MEGGADMEQGVFITAQEVAELLGISKSKVLEHKGRIFN